MAGNYSNVQRWVRIILEIFATNFNQVFGIHSDSNVVSTLDQIDDLTSLKIIELALENVDQLKNEILKSQLTIIGVKKKAYFATIFGTLLYDLSLLFGVRTSIYLT